MSLPPLALSPDKFQLLRTRALPTLGMLLIVPAAGALGGGVLVTHQAFGTDLTITYGPETHLNVPTTWKVDESGALGGRGTYSLRLDLQDFTHFKIADITPAPIATSQSDDSMIYTFSVANGTTVTFTLLPTSVGKTPATIQYGVDPPVPFSLSTLP